MEVHALVKKANQIGAYFEAYSDPGWAVGEVAKHLRNFWDPRMRKQLIAYVEQNGGSELTSLVREAVMRLAEETGVHAAG